MDDIVMRELMRAGWRNDFDSDAIEGRYPLDEAFARKAAQRITPTSTTDDILDILEKESVRFVGKQGAPMHLLAYEIHERLNRDHDKIVWG